MPMPVETISTPAFFEVLQAYGLLMKKQNGRNLFCSILCNGINESDETKSP